MRLHSLAFVIYHGINYCVQLLIFVASREISMQLGTEGQTAEIGRICCDGLLPESPPASRCG